MNRDIVIRRQDGSEPFDMATDEFAGAILTKAAIPSDALFAKSHKLWFKLARGSDEVNAGIVKYAGLYPELLTVTEADTEQTALHCAFEAGAEQNVLSLLDLGASLSAVCKVRRTVFGCVCDARLHVKCLVYCIIL